MSGLSEADNYAKLVNLGFYSWFIDVERREPPVWQQLGEQCAVLDLQPGRRKPLK